MVKHNVYHLFLSATASVSYLEKPQGKAKPIQTDGVGVHQNVFNVSWSPMCCNVPVEKSPNKWFLRCDIRTSLIMINLEQKLGINPRNVNPLGF
jgi:ribonuclease I